MVLLLIIAAILLVSFASLAGIVFFLRKKPSEHVLFALVSLATGTLLGAAFFELLPEAIAESEATAVLGLALAGFLAFFALEKVFLWHHHHESEHHEHPVGYLNLISDGVHNFFDGAVIAAAFLTAPPVGIATTIAVLLHEIPQEIGDLGLLLYSGFSLKKAVLFNFLTALTALVGGLVFYFAANTLEGLKSAGLAFTAGMFIYIASADLVPTLHKETNPKQSLLQLGLIILGAGAILAIGLFFAE
ncbi:hypothetical protein AUJ14_04045 [Candidatus Micrarchaeota archaeon CG1_02_55_22]|nr:MAG: hypothetical protein AUJ14_04045 [Candidatus Micrarchaeota archaeon CG1_02_55_22]